MAQPLGKTAWQSLRNLKTVTVGPSNSTPRYIPNRMEDMKACTWMLAAALFLKAKKCKQLKCPSTNEWINKMWYIYTMRYYLPLERSVKYWNTATMLWHGWTLKTLSERSQIQKATYCVIPFTLNVQNRQSHRHRNVTSGFVVVRGWGKSDGHTTLWNTKTTQW